MTLFLASLLGLFAIAFGAFAEHGLKDSVSSEQFEFLMTAVRYNQIQAVVLVVIGLTLLSEHGIAKLKVFKLSALLMLLGTVVFCGSIYSSVVFDLLWLTSITPAGGMSMMAGWLCLALSATLVNRQLKH